MRYLATAIPGIAPLLREELLARPDVERVGGQALDGRNDLVAFEARGDAALDSLRTAEDVLVEIGQARRVAEAGALAAGLLDEGGLARALSVYAARVRPLGRRMTVRAVVRVLSERDFQRRELRDRLLERMLERRPHWRLADPAELELWACEGPAGSFRLALRLTTSAMRHRGGRARERPGALRPTVAAAMVLLAGAPGGLLYDPCCGSGTILLEARSLGWPVAGSDVDPAAVAAARANLGGSVDLRQADALALPLEDESIGALVANLPFGRRFELPGDARSWFARLAGELARITRPGAPLVLPTAPGRDVERGLERPGALAEVRRLELNLLGVRATIRRLERAGGG